METRILSFDEKKVFKEQYEAIKVGHVSMSYLEESLVRGIFDERNVMVAGFVINSFFDQSRYLNYIPHHQQDSMQFAADDMVEITCFWINGRAIRSRFKRLWIYALCLVDSYAAEKTYIFGGTTNHKLRSIQQLVLSQDVWSGHAPNGTFQFVYCTQRSKLLANFFLGTLRYLSKSSTKAPYGSGMAGFDASGVNS